MSTTTTTPPESTLSLSAGRAARVGGLALLLSLVGNLAILLVGRLAGAEMEVVQTGTGKEMTIGLGAVGTMTILPIALGTVALLVARRWGARGWSALAWLGLALGVLTVFMPFTVDASTATAVTLATMHVVTGVAWLVSVRRGLGA